MYSSCSLDCCFTGARPGGLGEAGAEPLSWATRVEEKGRVWPCLEVWRLEPYSSSEVEAYSTGTRRHRETADRGKAGSDDGCDVQCLTLMPNTSTNTHKDVLTCLCDVGRSAFALVGQLGGAVGPGSGSRRCRDIRCS